MEPGEVIVVMFVLFTLLFGVCHCWLGSEFVRELWMLNPLKILEGAGHCLMSIGTQFITMLLLSGRWLLCWIVQERMVVWESWPRVFILLADWKTNISCRNGCWHPVSVRFLYHDNVVALSVVRSGDFYSFIVVYSRSGSDFVVYFCVRKTGNIQHKLLSEKSRVKQIKEAEINRGGSSTMASSPVTPTPPSMTSRMARPPDRSVDMRAIIKQQEISRDLPLPSLTATQISTCKNVLLQLKQKIQGNGGRNMVDREFDTLQVCRCNSLHEFVYVCNT